MPKLLTRSTTLLLCCGMAIALAGCGGDVRRSLGLTKQSPDEFRVVSRAPLSVPPSFSLRPPAPGAQRPQEASPEQRARQAVFRVEEREQTAALPEEGVDDSLSTGERSLLREAGADRADPDIRQKVERETRQINEESRDFADMLIFWKDPEPQYDRIDPGAEARRLRGSDAMGERPTGEGVPVIERQRRSLFDRLF